MSEETPKEQEEADASEGQTLNTIRVLGTALFLRTNFLRCPVCLKTLLNGGTHGGSCIFGTGERLAQGIGLNVFKQNLELLKF